MEITTTKYTVEGTGANGQTWKCEGHVPMDIPDPECLTAVLRSSFNQLTGGKAIYGQPGVGCRGPYKFVRIELKTGEQD